MERTPLPREYEGTVFTVRDARGDGIPEGRLSAGDLITPFRGVRAPRDAPASTTLDRCALLLPRLTGRQFFCHVTAAEIWGLPLPAWVHHQPLHVGAVAPAREPRLPGVTGHRLTREEETLALHAGMPVTSAAHTWVSLGAARKGPPLSIDELIAAADHLLTAGLADRDQLAAAIPSGARGAIALREALAEIRAGAESPRETQTRLLLTRAGMPMPELNWSLRDADGRFVARLDLAYPAYRTCVEYDGRQHASGEQFARDVDRWAAIADEGWTMIRVLAHHFADPHRLIVPRVRRALTAAGWH